MPLLHYWLVQMLLIVAVSSVGSVDVATATLKGSSGLESWCSADRCRRVCWLVVLLEQPEKVLVVDCESSTGLFCCVAGWFCCRR